MKKTLNLCNVSMGSLNEEDAFHDLNGSGVACRFSKHEEILKAFNEGFSHDQLSYT